MQTGLEPNEITTLSEIIVNVVLFFAGWITRLLQTKNKNNDNKN